MTDTTPTPVADALQAVDANRAELMSVQGEIWEDDVSSERDAYLGALENLADAVRSHGNDTITRSQLIHALTEQDVIATTPRAAGYTAEQFADLLMITGRECRQHHGPAMRVDLAGAVRSHGIGAELGQLREQRAELTDAQLQAAFLAARQLGKVLDDDVLRAVILAAR